MPSEGWANLARVIRGERARRRQKQDQFAAQLGISTRTLRSIERAEHTGYDERTITAVETGLAWRTGSFEQVIAGREPRTSDRDLAAILAAWPHLPPDTRATLAQVASEAARHG